MIMSKKFDFNMKVSTGTKNNIIFKIGDKDPTTGEFVNSKPFVSNPLIVTQWFLTDLIRDFRGQKFRSDKHNFFKTLSPTSDSKSDSKTIDQSVCAYNKNPNRLEPPIYAFYKNLKKQVIEYLYENQEKFTKDKDLQTFALFFKGAKTATDKLKNIEEDPKGSYDRVVLLPPNHKDMFFNIDLDKAKGLEQKYAGAGGFTSVFDKFQDVENAVLVEFQIYTDILKSDPRLETFDKQLSDVKIYDVSNHGVEFVKKTVAHPNGAKGIIGDQKPMDFDQIQGLYNGMPIAVTHVPYIILMKTAQGDINLIIKPRIVEIFILSFDKERFPEIKKTSSQSARESDTSYVEDEIDPYEGLVLPQSVVAPTADNLEASTQSEDDSF
jgi:hypothetical protein